MSKHLESVFETEVVQYMSSNGWVEGDPKKYDKEKALYPEDLLTFIKTTQPDNYSKLEKHYGNDTDRQILKRVDEQLEKEGSLFYLRNELKDRGAKFKLCQFKPASNINTDAKNRYDKNILRVVRQIKYSTKNENCIDLVLFLNGIPLVTIELKTDFTQNIQDAIWQYKKDRDPKGEKLLEFKKRALVHFAVSTDEVHMATKLAGTKTVFLPFNKGANGGAGNPQNPDGYTTAYLWEEIFAKETFLNILEKYVHLEQKNVLDAAGKQTKKESLIFPRYHQLDAVSKLVETTKFEGPGHKYLIQHSAGSGKSNSIAWLAHQLASLHNNKDTVIFDTVVVVTDRNVLDSQLQETISSFGHKDGVIARINREDSSDSKSTQLGKSLKDGVKIIIVTIQTFPFVLSEIQQTSSLKKKNFAIIADEAHSSWSGSTAKKLQEVLMSEKIEEDVEMSADDILSASIASRGTAENISYFAFTATPKAKTLQIFGRAKDPSKPQSDENPPIPFHLYSMKQAIEEGFILDVLQNYITYSVAYKMATEAMDNKDVDTSKAKVKLTKWARLHPYNIAQKIEIIIEHFKNNVAPLLNGQAKAMVVTNSRLEALRYKKAFDDYIAENKYQNIQAMVAFSGTLTDEGKDYTEKSKDLNPHLNGRDMRKAFETDEYQVMLVANKFQTGFDQPKLVAMYVDKALGGVEAVQTLSRLNRTYPGKDMTFILDFVNKEEDIKAAFNPYYQQTNLSGVTDPNIVYDLQGKLNKSDIYTEQEVLNFADVFFDPNGTQAKMNSIMKAPSDRWRVRYKDFTDKIKTADMRVTIAKNAKDDTEIHNAEHELKELKIQRDELVIFKKDLLTFVRMYEFLSQIINYEDEDLERLSVFAKYLYPLLVITSEDIKIDTDNLVMTHFRIKKQGEHTITLESEEIDPDKPGGAVGRDRKKDSIDHIIEEMNKIIGADLTNADMLSYANTIKDKISENKSVMEQISINTKEQAMMGDFITAVNDAIVDSYEAHTTIADEMLDKNNGRKRDSFAKLILDILYAEKEMSVSK
jgi:type I restriction enzyme, R subunit